MQDVTIAGAGVSGLAVALALARRGARVRVCDPASLGDNASGVAAGMLAPAMEAALDPLSATHFELLKAARDLWPDFAPVEISREGAVYVAEAVEVEKVGRALARVGASHRPASEELAGLFAFSGVFTDEDWRLEPLDALKVLREAALAAGVEFAREEVSEPGGGVLVLATGSAPGPAPELDVITPIKGHVLRLSGGPASGPVIRGEGVYVAPGRNGAIVGATMEQGTADRFIDEARVKSLRDHAVALAPVLAGLKATPQAAVRAGTPDGLPLVGWSAARGVFLTVGARRNGWLLAPLVAQVTAAYLAGEDPGPLAAKLDAQRFSRGA
ncbi:MAG TPA: FAD-dependent oxidoreductase [Caulobacteraceae bacterium]|nr:FAD-dependent oxidoreductase [Caulobacteraceae bacterium]